MTEEFEREIGQLKRQGNYQKAAERCLAAGKNREAAELLAEIWEYEKAIELAVAEGQIVDAYRYAIMGNRRSDIERFLQELAGHPEHALAAAKLAELRGRPLDAALLYESLADLDTAATLFEAEGELFEAARLRESQGNYRVAGRLYERRLKQVPDDAETALRLGRILARFGRHDHAVRALQKVEANEEKRPEAIRLMIACFHALGLDEAAGHRLHDLRQVDPSVPITVSAFLTEEYGDEDGLSGFGEREQFLALRYRILKPLGAGATGRVLLAHDAFYDRNVAVKVLTVGAGGVGRDAYVRFAKEARVAAGLSHPNVVPVYEFNPDGPFLAMEYMAGGTLEDRFKEVASGRLPPPVIHHVISSVLSGLSVVHRRGVIHRDLKPANIFFSETGEVKIGDFGVAHLADLGATLTGALMGTLAYMAPEQVTGSVNPSAATDFYAVGVILFRMLTGRLPFPGPDFVVQHLESPIPLLADVAPEYTHLDPLMTSLLAKELDDRPEFAHEVQARIDEHSWEEVGRSATEIAMGVARRPSTVPPPAPEPDESEHPAVARYSVLGDLGSGATLCRDEILLRRVRIEPCDADRAEVLKKFAKADHPGLQAVLELDEERAVLEFPAGPLLSESELSLVERRQVLDDVALTLKHLHDHQVAHGEITASHIRVGSSRNVLLLPRSAVPSASADGDEAMLAQLYR